MDKNEFRRPYLNNFKLFLLFFISDRLALIGINWQINSFKISYFKISRPYGQDISMVEAFIRFMKLAKEIKIEQWSQVKLAKDVKGVSF